MTTDELVEKLHEMRQVGPEQAMTELFGLIFHEEIGSSANRIGDEYNKKGYKGKLNATNIRTGLRMALYADPRPDVVGRWKGTQPRRIIPNERANSQSLDDLTIESRIEGGLIWFRIMDGHPGHDPAEFALSPILAIWIAEEILRAGRVMLEPEENHEASS